MKLLIVTQAIDLDDPILGFFHAWVAALAKRFEHIEVICLKRGRHALPQNVSIHSLGKETHWQGGMIYHTRARFSYAVRFGWLIWELRNNYDRVFVHMNPEYVMLGWLDWRVMGKRVALWYNHPHKDLKFKIAAGLAGQIFYTSPYAAPAGYKKARQMPVGIDTELFKPRAASRNRYGLYMQGRVAPSKRVHVLLEALRILRKTDSVTLTLVGPEDAGYGNVLRERFGDLIAAGAVTFAGPRANEETPELYNAHGSAVNLSAAGHFDKSVFEAMACETPVVVSSKAFKGLVPDEWIVPENDPHALADALARLVALSEGAYRSLGAHERTVVVREHGLATLMDVLARELSTPYHSEA